MSFRVAAHPSMEVIEEGCEAAEQREENRKESFWTNCLSFLRVCWELLVECCCWASCRKKLGFADNYEDAYYVDSAYYNDVYDTNENLSLHSYNGENDNQPTNQQVNEIKDNDSNRHHSQSSFEKNGDISGDKEKSEHINVDAVIETNKQNDVTETIKNGVIHPSQNRHSFVGHLDSYIDVDFSKQSEKENVKDAVKSRDSDGIIDRSKRVSVI